MFYDRLTTDKDHTLVSDHISELLQQHFSGHAEVYIIYVCIPLCVDVFPGIHMHCISTHILQNESQSLSEVFSLDANYYQEAKMSENFSCTSLVLHRYGIFR